MVSITTKEIGTTKTGEQLFSVSLKTKVDKNTGDIIQGLKPGEELIVEKLFKGGLQGKFEGSYNIKFYIEEEGVKKLCSTYVNTKQHVAYEAAGDMGAKVKITAYNREYMYGDEKKTTLDFKFETVQ